jgi:hypothetical protein
MNRLDVDAPEIDIGQLGFGKGYARKAQWAAARQAPAGYHYMAGESYPIIEAVRNHLAANPGSSTPSCWKAFSGGQGQPWMKCSCYVRPRASTALERRGMGCGTSGQTTQTSGTQLRNGGPHQRSKQLSPCWGARGCLRRIRIP